MLIYDTSRYLKVSPEVIALDAYIKGVCDAAPFKEEDHPRGAEGSGKGGQFVKSEKTKQKEDEVDNIAPSNSNKYYLKQKDKLEKLIEKYHKSEQETGSQRKGESAEEYLHRAMETTKIGEEIEQTILNLDTAGYRVFGQWRKGQPISIKEDGYDYNSSFIKRPRIFYP